MDRITARKKFVEIHPTIRGIGLGLSLEIHWDELNQEELMGVDLTKAVELAKAGMMNRAGWFVLGSLEVDAELVEVLEAAL